MNDGSWVAGRGSWATRPRVLRPTTRDLFLAVALLLAAFLRFDHLGGPSYWLDEILGDQLTTSAKSAPWWHWITGL